LSASDASFLESLRHRRASHHQRGDRSPESAGMQSVAAPCMPNDRPSFRDGRNGEKPSRAAWFDGTCGFPATAVGFLRPEPSHATP
jgi:hypothetical protein